MAVEISVIVPVHNDFRIQQCIESLLQQDLSKEEFELLIVDNGSYDLELQRLIERYPVRFLVEYKLGSYAARNHGIREAHGSILAFTDADCIAPPQWLRTIRDHLQRGCCRICSGGSYSLDASFVPRCIQAVDDIRWQELNRQQNVHYADTRNLAALREIFNEQLFDERFQSAGDLDFGLTVTKTGERIHFLPELKVEHRHPQSLLASIQRGIRRGWGIGMIEHKHGRGFAISGERKWIVFGKDRKAALLRIARIPLLRYLMILIVTMTIALLFCELSLVRIFAMRSALGPRIYYFLDRSSLLLGRLLE